MIGFGAVTTGALLVRPLSAPGGAAALPAPASVVVATIAGDGTTAAFPVTHDLGHQAVLVQVSDAATKAVVAVDISLTNETSITVTFGSPPPQGASYQVVVVG
jgi:hypothetical protein